MNKDNCEQPNPKDDNMLPEYDFTNGVHGKHYLAYRQGHTVTVRRDSQDLPIFDGTISSKSDKNYECRN